MKVIGFVIALGVLFAPARVLAVHRYHRHAHHRHWRRVRGRLDHTCARAAALGGPCGCFASELEYGHSVRHLWLARAWYAFPHTFPHSGAVAVRPHHVVVVEAYDGHGVVTVHDSWGVHRQSTRGWTFVEPRQYFASGDELASQR